ncbi:hemagglutinin [Mycoplasmopsis synoviae]|uniref:hemagglutinin n=1 Tax=Mycoplasmopsis synoviae TaxID=2109 RepID=UPI0035673A47
MPKIVVDGYVADGAGANKAQHETENTRLLQQWFDTPANWEKLSEQLTKKLGSSKFKNIVLTSPMVSYEDTSSNTRVPKVTFTLQGKEGYELQTTDGASATLSLSIRVLYTSESSTQNVLRYQGASSSAAPNRASNPNDATTIKNVNVYLNYTGPDIVLDQDLPTVGTANNTSLNGTSNVDDAFNTAFRGNPSSGLLFTNRYPNPLLQSVINYVNKFDPKYRATFVTNSRDGVTITKVESGTQLRPGTLDDLNKNNVFLQQIKGDTEAVYFAVTAIASNNWLNTFLIRIPLTKFVKPLTVFTATPTSALTQDSLASNTSPQTITQSS